jgi:hypothetical protein
MDISEKQDEAIDTLLSDIVKNVVGEEFTQKAGEISHEMNNMFKNYNQHIDEKIAKANDEFFTWQFMSCIWRIEDFHRNFYNSPKDYILTIGDMVPNTGIKLRRTAIRMDLREPFLAVSSSFKEEMITTLYVQDIKSKDFMKYSQMAYWYGNKSPFKQSNIIDLGFPDDLMEKIMKTYTEDELIITNLGRPLLFEEIGEMSAFDWNFFLIACVSGSLTGQYSKWRELMEKVCKNTQTDK